VSVAQSVEFACGLKATEVLFCFVFVPYVQFIFVWKAIPLSEALFNFTLEVILMSEALFSQSNARRYVNSILEK
jgi:hypothetical protein